MSTSPLLRFHSRWLAIGLCGLWLTLPLPAKTAELAAIQTARPDTATPALKPLPATLEKAKRQIESQKPADALATLKPYVNASPKPPQLDQAYLLMGAAYKAAKQYNESIAALNFLVGEFPNSPILERAKLLLAMDHSALNHPDQALALLTDVRSTTQDANTKRDALALTGTIFAQKKDTARAIQAWLEEMELGSDEAAGRIQAFVKDKLDRKALGLVRDTYPTAFPGDMALIRLIEYHIARGEDHLAERQIQLFLTRFPSHDYAAKASELLTGFSTRLKTSQAVIVAYLPLSGKLALYGTEAVNGVQIAMEKAKESFGQQSIGLVIKDSGGGRPGHNQDLAQALDEHRPLAVIGPMVSKQLPALAELAERQTVPFITPTAMVSDIRQYGTYLFSSALTYQLQARRLATYAAGQLGFKRFCILAPDAPYGRELTALFSREIAEQGGEIIAVDSYKEGDTDFGQAIKRLKAADLKKYGVTTPLTTTKGLKRDLYAPGFDAIFVPGRAVDVALLAPQLLYHDIKVPLLGINSWNATPHELITDQVTDGSVFVDGFFAGSVDPSMQEFAERYRKRFQSEPSIFAAQAFDAASIVLEAIRKGATSGSAVHDYLASQQEVTTLAGPARFDSTGTLVRRVFVIGIRQRRLVQLE